MSFNMIFLLYSVIFIIILLYGGFITKKWITGSNDYFIAGREVSLLINVFGVAAIGFAGTMITLIPGLALTTGFWGSLGFGLVYAIGGLALYGIIFAPYIRRSGAHTLSEWLEMRYDAKTRTLITVTTILGLLGIMANNVVSMAMVATGFTGWPIIWTLSVIFFMFLLFTYIGGFWAVTLTDFIQMCIGLIALPVLFITVLTQFGGTSFISSNWAGDFSYWTSGFANAQMSIFSLKYPSILTFIVLFACFLVWGNNYYWLRVSSTRSERTAKLSFVYGALLLFIPTLILAFIGLFAGSMFADQFAPNGTANPMSAFGVVLTVIPVGIAALALTGALAASISTSTTALIGASSTAVRDFYQRYFKPNATSKQLTTPSKVITLILGLLVWLLCFYPGGPLYLFAFSTAWLGPPSILVFLGIWWKRTSIQGAFWGAILGIFVLILFTVLDLAGIFNIAQYTHIGVVGLVVTLTATILISLVTKPNYYGAKDWKEESVIDPIEVNEDEKSVLKLIHFGYNTMAEVSDMLGVDSSVSNKIVESLDQKRLITRQKYTGPGFYTFELAKDAKKYFSLTNEQKRMSEDNVSFEDILFLQKLNEGTDVLQKYLKQQEYDSLKASVVLAKLIKQNHVKEFGVWRRKVTITETGKRLVNKYPPTTIQHSSI
ncbi:sodium:solute symporter family protein [Alkalihalobacterium sp. APHAB7]|uniref:sodium:solute symporter family protein n=1 Tax=Alkalihalobacterium sp. APHAB7 TaxID=3402081 RepID=UPI003AAF1E62